MQSLRLSYAGMFIANLCVMVLKGALKGPMQAGTVLHIASMPAMVNFCPASDP